ncbi:pentapeptide repeat-containing protein [Labrenzia sp. R4_1]|uniref:pentapeptide repeat-containing protein n=1 Tax=Labrenzia sp. R4_1 TaxID=2821106 RepID=UPI001ADB0294|nr:pentapeptide repeat-containing protein [Labrenzia sp. R4_1]MBO9424672.1 pentapeptide repeat-containing protein [Labrenzia sp. R4_1]
MNKNIDQPVMAMFATLGLLLLLVVVINWPEITLWVSAECNGTGWYCLIHTWQDLLAGLFVIFAAYLGWVQVKKQIQANEEQVQRQIRANEVQQEKTRNITRYQSAMEMLTKTDGTSFLIAANLCCDAIDNEPDVYFLTCMELLHRALVDLRAKNAQYWRMVPPALERIASCRAKHRKLEIEEMQRTSKLFLYDLTQINFAQLPLGRADFSRCALAGADFQGCILNGVDFSNSELSGAVFTKAILNQQTKFTGARALRQLPPRGLQQPYKGAITPY